MLQSIDHAEKNTAGNSVKSYHKMYLEVLDQQRKLLNDLNQKSEFDEDLIRKYLSLVDIEEYKLREKQIQDVDLGTD